MDSGSSSVERRHLLSQGWKHTREQMAARGFLSRCSASASSKRFSPIRLTKPGTSTPAGQAFWHGARTSSGQTPARHFLSRMCSTNSSRKWRMADSTGLGAVWPRPHSAVSLIVSPRSIRRSMSPSCPLPSQMRSRISSIRLVPIRQGVHLPHDSSCTNSRKNRDMSTMQVSSSMTMRPPEPMMAPSSVRDS